jgi:hypothetical protein
MLRIAFELVHPLNVHDIIVVWVSMSNLYLRFPPDKGGNKKGGFNFPNSLYPPCQGTWIMEKWDLLSLDGRGKKERV